MGSLLVVKLAVTMVAVVGLTLVAERVSTRLAGVLAGFPHGIAIVLFFIGIEQGPEFAAQAAGLAIAGLGANVVLAFTYARLAEKLSARSTGKSRAQTGMQSGARTVVQAGAQPGTRPPPSNVVAAAAGALAAFLALALALRLVAPGPVLATGLTLAAVGVTRWLLRGLGQGLQSEKPRVGLGELVLRAGLAGAIVVTITGMAALVGPDWAGLLAGFPVVTFPVLLIMHARHGAAPVEAIVRHYPFGILSLLVFTLTVRWSFLALGMGWGTLAGLAAAALYLLAATALKVTWRQAR